MSTHRKRFIKEYKLEDKSYNLSEIAKITGFKKSVLQKVYNRGVGAWKTNPSSVRLKNFTKNGNTTKYPKSARLTKEQWAYARVYSFVMGGKTSKTADKDLYEIK